MIKKLWSDPDMRNKTIKLWKSYEEKGMEFLRPYLEERKRELERIKKS
jgi:hypothetical protein